MEASTVYLVYTKGSRTGGLIWSRKCTVKSWPEYYAATTTFGRILHLVMLAETSYGISSPKPGVTLLCTHDTVVPVSYRQVRAYRIYGRHNISFHTWDMQLLHMYIHLTYYSTYVWNNIIKSAINRNIHGRIWIFSVIDSTFNIFSYCTFFTAIFIGIVQAVLRE